MAKYIINLTNKIEIENFKNKKVINLDDYGIDVLKYSLNFSKAPYRSGQLEEKIEDIIYGVEELIKSPLAYDRLMLSNDDFFTFIICKDTPISIDLMNGLMSQFNCNIYLTDIKGD